MAEIIVTPRARRDIDEAIAQLGLPADTWARVGRSVRLLRDFPLAGRALEGRWAPARFVLGPWPWMILLYVFDETTDRVHLVGGQDARAATSPRASG